MRYREGEQLSSYYDKESANKKVADQHRNLFLANSLLIGRAGIK